MSIFHIPAKNKAVRARLDGDNDDYKEFTPVIRQFTTKFAQLTRVFRCTMCKQGQYT